MGGQTVCVNDAGRFFACTDDFLERFSSGSLSDTHTSFLRREGHYLEIDDALGHATHTRNVAKRLSVAGPLNYLILVPTLRCNLSCSYCQVSRVNVEQQGFDWTSDTLAAVLRRIDELDTDHLKIEFQGGEPTLRSDLIRAVIDGAQRFVEKQFVICTNLQNVTEDALALFDRPDVFISTSLDGLQETHRRNRTGDDASTQRFLENLRMIIDRYGPSKVSALPTVDASNPPAIADLIDAYTGFGLDSIFLRPINYQGFARKRHTSSREQGDEWRAYYEQFVLEMIDRNWADRSRVLEETYFSIGLRRIFRPGKDRHVDLRNPNPMGIDYVVVDYDGTIYPTDEARMLTRSGVIDLSIGDVVGGWKTEKRDRLNDHSSNQFDPHCSRCAYQPFCGRDVIDDIARYGSIDLPRPQTEFCKKHMHLFDFIFRLIYTDSPKVRFSLAKWLRLPSVPASFGPILT